MSRVFRPMQQSATDILRRWMSLDAQLFQCVWGRGLHITSFAKKWNVDPKTIRRDLAAFLQLGYETYWERFEEGEYLWTYSSEQKPMFVKSYEQHARRREANRAREAKVKVKDGMLLIR